MAKILIVGASWIGDMVMAQSLFITLKQQHPECQIDVLAPSWTFYLLDRMPEVAHALVMPLSHGQLGLLARIKLGKQLSQHKYDQVIMLPNSLKSAITPFFANIPLRTGYIGECRWGLLNDARKLDKKLLTQTVQRFVALAYPKTSKTKVPECPVPKLSVSSDCTDHLQKFQLQIPAKILVLCSGAEYGASKRWKPEYFAAVAKHYLARNWQVWLLGSVKDQANAVTINQSVQHACRDFTGQTTIAEAVDLISLADMVLSNDSGLMHVAAGLNKNLVAIYGSSDPLFTPPMNKNSQVISLGLECSPCFKRECSLGHVRCLTDISPQQVLLVMAELLDENTYY